MKDANMTLEISSKGIAGNDLNIKWLQKIKSKLFIKVTVVFVKQSTLVNLNGL